LSTDPRWHTGVQPTREDVLSEVARELAMRRGVFPRWVQSGKITQAQADKRIDALQAAYDFIMEKWPKTQMDLIK
jgi:hypothetical protein